MVIGIGVGVFVVATLASVGVTALLLPVLRRKAILDHPNERASHTHPTPRGGGIAVMPVILSLWAAILYWYSDVPIGLATVIGCAAMLAMISWVDDLRGLTALTRLLSHIAAAVVGLAGMPENALVFQGLLPGILDKVLACLIWVWFINLFNFMDGIDGITGVQSMAIGLGAFGLSALSALMPSVGILGLAVAGAAVGFLAYNWHPAKLFIGDVGSIPLGFLLGWLLLVMAVQGYWVSALLLPLYYLTDSTLTLARRALRGERVWRAHREHFYQRAHQAGLSHAAIASRVAAADIVLICLAVVAAMGHRGAALLGGIVVVAILLIDFAATEKGRAA